MLRQGGGGLRAGPPFSAPEEGSLPFLTQDEEDFSQVGTWTTHYQGHWACMGSLPPQLAGTSLVSGSGFLCQEESVTGWRGGLAMS